MKPYVEFSNGSHMPILGLGTWQATDEKELEVAINEALKAGYRHIDTAYLYTNEDVIGRVLHEWLSSGRIKREELFVVTKLPPTGLRPDKVSYFINKSLKSLQLDYVDLYLIHSAVGLKFISDTELLPMENGAILFDMDTDLEAVWKAMENEVDAGKAKAIGVSNFDEDQLRRILDIARIPPSNIQVELHVYMQQTSLREVCAKNNVTVCAYGPFGSPGRKLLYEKRGQTFECAGILEDPVIIEMANKYRKTVAQVLLRFYAQEGIVIIPKSVNPERIKANYQIFDFEVTPSDVELLRSLDRREGGRTFTFKGFIGADKHPECPKYAKRHLELQEN